jgi:RecB family exonuclease
MDFTVRNLSVLAYAQGFTLWHYKAPADPLAMLTVPGFFDHACDMLAAGDMVMMSASDGGRLAFVAAATDRVTLAAMM